MQRMRLLGVDKDTTERYKNRRAWDYDVVSEGYRYHLTNMMASVGVSQLRRVDEFIASRQRVLQRLQRRLPRHPRRPRSGYRLHRRIAVHLQLARAQWPTRSPHRPHAGPELQRGHPFPAGARAHGFPRLPPRRSECDGKVAGEVLTLPLHSNMKPDFAERVIEGVRSFFAP